MTRPRARAPSADPLDSRTAGTLADRLHSAAIHLLRRLRRGDEAEGLSAPRLSALSVIVTRGPITLGELAAAEQVRAPSMTRLVQALEADGLVRREADASDRRVVRLRATARGRSLLARGRARRVAALAEELARLGPDDAEVLRRGVEVIERIVGRGPHADRADASSGDRGGG